MSEQENSPPRLTEEILLTSLRDLQRDLVGHMEGYLMMSADMPERIEQAKSYRPEPNRHQRRRAAKLNRRRR